MPVLYSYLSLLSTRLFIFVARFALPLNFLQHDLSVHLFSQAVNLVLYLYHKGIFGVVIVLGIDIVLQTVVFCNQIG